MPFIASPILFSLYARTSASLSHWKVGQKFKVKVGIKKVVHRIKLPIGAPCFEHYIVNRKDEVCEMPPRAAQIFHVFHG